VGPTVRTLMFFRSLLPAKTPRGKVTFIILLFHVSHMNISSSLSPGRTPPQASSDSSATTPPIDPTSDTVKTSDVVASSFRTSSAPISPLNSTSGVAQASGIIHINGTNKSSIGAIVGGVVGGLALSALTISLILYIHHRRHHIVHILGREYRVSPFTIPRSNPGVVHNSKTRAGPVTATAFSAITLENRSRTEIRNAQLGSALDGVHQHRQPSHDKNTGQIGGALPGTASYSLAMLFWQCCDGRTCRAAHAG
jgi:hypothetical protein